MLYNSEKKKNQKLLFCEINILYCIGLELCKVLKTAYCLPLARGSGKPIAQPGRGNNGSFAPEENFVFLKDSWLFCGSQNWGDRICQCSEINLRVRLIWYQSSDLGGTFEHMIIR